MSRYHLLIIIAIFLIACSCGANRSLTKGRVESVRRVEIYFLPLNNTARIYTDISDLRKRGYILINRKPDMLKKPLEELKSLRESEIDIDDMDFQMYFIFHFSNGKKDRIAFDSKSRIYINGKTCSKNHNAVKNLIDCLPMGFREVWLERRYHEF